MELYFNKFYPKLKSKTKLDFYRSNYRTFFVRNANSVFSPVTIDTSARWLALNDKQNETGEGTPAIRSCLATVIRRTVCWASYIFFIYSVAVEFCCKKYIVSIYKRNQVSFGTLPFDYKRSHTLLVVGLNVDYILKGSTVATVLSDLRKPNLYILKGKSLFVCFEGANLRTY